jgi:hypothetical protein
MAVLSPIGGHATESRHHIVDVDMATNGDLTGCAGELDVPRPDCVIHLSGRAPKPKQISGGYYIERGYGQGFAGYALYATGSEFLLTCMEVEHLRSGAHVLRARAVSRPSPANPQTKTYYILLYKPTVSSGAFKNGRMRVRHTDQGGPCGGGSTAGLGVAWATNWTIIHSPV